MPRTLSADDIETFRNRLVDAATHLFAVRGRDGVSMRELAAALGVSPMTPYRYFHDKGEILAAVRTRAFDRFAEALETAYETAAGDAGDRSSAVGRAYVEFAFENPEAYRLMFDLAEVDDDERYPELARATERARATMSRHLRPLIEEGVIEGEPDLIGHMLWATVHGAVELKLAGKLARDCDFERLVQEATSAMMRGLAPR